MTPEVARTIRACRAAIGRAGATGERIGFVPTMGALHAGHLSLVDRARAAADRVVVSIYVNAAQFDDPADLAAYPRDLEADLARLEGRGVDLVFAPSSGEMVPRPPLTRVTMDGITDRFEGAARPGHFDAVLTVVAQLLHIVQPDVAVFGQKDAQQAAAVTRMAADLHMPVAIEVAPTVRDADGLALSSRNARLSAAEREEALGLSRALAEARARFAAGERDAGALESAMREALDRHARLAVEYAAVADRDTFEPVARVTAPAVAVVAGRVGETRLIDNAVLDPAGG